MSSCTRRVYLRGAKVLKPKSSARVSVSPNREVFKARHRLTGKKVALKKVLMDDEKEGVRDRKSFLMSSLT